MSRITVVLGRRREYVRCSDGIRKWYKAVLEENHTEIRVSRRRLERADEAAYYGKEIVARLMRMRGK
jgi:hypothetical protein